MGEQDRTGFRDAIGRVRQLRQDRVTPKRARRRPIPEQTLRDERDVLKNLLTDDEELADVETGEELAYHRPGLQHAVMRRLRRGQYAIEAELDLHGHTVPEARAALERFLIAAGSAGKRCVRVIHGKGKSAEGKIPVLKGKVNGWLRRNGAVLAYCSARRNDGGTGAVYVLLKRR